MTATPTATLAPNFDAGLVGGIFAGGIMIFGLVTVFWLIALVDILKSEFVESSNKVLWLILTLVLPFLGPILYFIIGRKQTKKGSGISLKSAFAVIAFFIWSPLGVILMWLWTKWPMWLKVTLTTIVAILSVISFGTGKWWLL
jgi:hypothetical protein